MKRREFVAALTGLDRSRWPVQPGVAEAKIHDFYGLYEPDYPKPCIWVDSETDIRQLHEPQGTRRSSTLLVPHTVARLNNWSFPGRAELGAFWFVNDNEAQDILSIGNSFKDNIDRPQRRQAVELLYDAYVAGAFAVYEYAATRYVLSRPVMFTDDEGRLHHETKPAMAWFEGPYGYFIHGVGIESSLMDGSSRLTVADIYEYENIEVRRVLIERFGWGKFLKAIRARKIDEDPVHGVLWHGQAPREDHDFRRGIRLLELKDPSTSRKYFIRVPPNRGTALSARAWTFNKSVEEFKEQLVKET